MAYDIFISYRRKGGYETAKHLYDLLTRDGYKVSFDMDTLRNGDFNTELLKRIEECTDFILILNDTVFERSLDPTFKRSRDWLRNELACALENGKNIIPIMLDGFTEFPDNLPADIAGVANKNGPKYDQYYFDDFYKRLKESFLLTPAPPQGGVYERPGVVGMEETSRPQAQPGPASRFDSCDPGPVPFSFEQVAREKGGNAEVNSGDNSEGKTGGKGGKVAAIIIAVLLVLGGGGFGIYQFVVSPKEKTVEVTDDKEEVASEPETPVKADPPAPKPKGPAPATSSGYDLGWGRYEGPMSGGVPHGLDGTVTVTRSYVLDLKKGGAALDLNPGDKITGCKFKDGKLVSGRVQYKDGGEEKVYIGA